MERLFLFKKCFIIFHRFVIFPPLLPRNFFDWGEKSFRNFFSWGHFIFFFLKRDETSLLFSAGQKLWSVEPGWAPVIKNLLQAWFEPNLYPCNTLTGSKAYFKGFLKLGSLRLESGVGLMRAKNLAWASSLSPGSSFHIYSWRWNKFLTQARVSFHRH